MRARRVVICRHHELEDGRRKRLGKVDESSGFILGATAVLGDDDRFHASGEQDGDLVELRRWCQYWLWLDLRPRFERNRAYQEVEGYTDERWSLRDGLG
jgi:hypothetical protein